MHLFISTLFVYWSISPSIITFCIYVLSPSTIAFLFMFIPPLNKSPFLFLTRIYSCDRFILSFIYSWYRFIPFLDIDSFPFLTPPIYRLVFSTCKHIFVELKNTFLLILKNFTFTLTLLSFEPKIGHFKKKIP